MKKQAHSYTWEYKFMQPFDSIDEILNIHTYLFSQQFYC